MLHDCGVARKNREKRRNKNSLHGFDRYDTNKTERVRGIRRGGVLHIPT